MKTTEQFIMYINHKILHKKIQYDCLNLMLLIIALNSGKYEITDNLMVKGFHHDSVRQKILSLILNEKKDFLLFKEKLDLEKKLKNKLPQKNIKEKVKKI